MRVEYAEISLQGGREDNQDRVTAAVGPDAALLTVIDGMGGHAQGARAAELARRILVDSFWATPQPLLDPLGFLHVTLGQAHEEIVKLGANLPLEARPRATCAVCLVQEGAAWWAHVGDTRVYLLRNGGIADRTRDHSHVELLLQEGLITEAQAQNHPMRNFVECCLGGDPILPEMTVARRHLLQSQDLVLVCSDGFWANIGDEQIAGSLANGVSLGERLEALGQRAIDLAGPGSDNTSAAVLRWIG